jgi:hypothetical protein
MFFHFKQQDGQFTAAGRRGLPASAVLMLADKKLPALGIFPHPFLRRYPQPR